MGLPNPRPVLIDLRLAGIDFPLFSYSEDHDRIVLRKAVSNKVIDFSETFTSIPPNACGAHRALLGAHYTRITHDARTGMARAHVLMYEHLFQSNDMVFRVSRCVSSMS